MIIVKRTIGLAGMTSTLSTKLMLTWLLTPLARAVESHAQGWRKIWAFTRLRNNLRGVDPSVVVLDMPELHGTRRIHLGRNLYLYRELYLETQESGEISIGDDVVLSRGVHIVAFAGIEIGAGSMIGEYASLRDANHRFGAAMNLRDSGHDARPIRIGRNVWIGRGVTILPGITVGDNAVIGANAVVTHDIPANTVAAGVPARALHSRGIA